MLGVDWENVNLAGAFVIGATLGTLATIRVMRAVLQTYERIPSRRTRGAKEPPPPEGDEGS